MEKLAEAMHNSATAICGLEDPERSAVFEPGLQTAAEEWATASLRLYTGDLLTKALGISAAMTDFLSELQECGNEALKAARPAMRDGIQAGDYVECVDASSGAHFLYVGRVYCVDSTQRDSDGKLRLNLRGMARAWEVERFKLTTGPQRRDGSA